MQHLFTHSFKRALSVGIFLTFSCDESETITIPKDNLDASGLVDLLSYINLKSSFSPNALTW